MSVLSNFVKLNRLFEGRTITSRPSCRGHALFMYRATTTMEAEHQGDLSYTLTCNPHSVIQYRHKSSWINLDIINLARLIHGDIVPHCLKLTTIGEGEDLLYVYLMKRMAGTPYCLARSIFVTMPLDARVRQHNTVIDLARYAFSLIPLSLRVTDSITTGSLLDHG